MSYKFAELVSWDSHRTFSIVARLCVVLLVLGLNSCHGPSENKTTAVLPIDSVQLDSVRFFVETSASMGGYFAQDAEFKTIISDLTSKIHNNIAPTSIWFIAEEKSRYPDEVAQFSSAIATTKIASQKSSQMHRIFEEIAQDCDSSTVVVFVSDCILSFPDADIKRNPEINRFEAPNALKNNIFNTFSSLKRQGLSASVYAFTSKFYGTYYDYQNRSVTLRGDLRPFYIWIIGHHALVNDFNDALADISTFKPQNYLHFGADDVPPVSSYELFTQIGRSGNWSREGDGVSGIGPATEAATFCIGMDLTSLPKYVQRPAYLTEHLEVTCEGCEAKASVKDKSTIGEKPKSKSQLESFAKASHFFLFEVTDLLTPSATVSFKLPYEYDTWYLDWSTDNDQDIQGTLGKTFAFEHLIRGVKEAYETKNAYYLANQILLKQ